MINFRRFRTESVRFVVCINNQIHMFMMIIQPKEQYISPECEVLTLQEEGVICSSVPDIGKGGEYTWP